MSRSVKLKNIKYLPVAISLSDLLDEDNDTIEYELGDSGLQEMQMYDNLQLETLTLQILDSLSDRDKIIFLYQLLRDLGYNISQEAFAKTLHLKKTSYMDKLLVVRHRINLIIKLAERYDKTGSFTL